MIPKRKFNAIVRDRNDCPEPNNVAAGNIKLLSNLSPQHAAKMGGMFASQRSNIFVEGIGDPAAASQNTVSGRQFSVVSQT
ncbi:MAG: hypothetical protein WA609_13560, partial [Terriglobales bacterium]